MAFKSQPGGKLHDLPYHLLCACLMMQKLVAKHRKNANLEIQTRACEYGTLFRFDGIRGQLMEAMPPLDEATYMARFNAPAVVASGPSLTIVSPLLSATEAQRIMGFDSLRLVLQKRIFLLS